MTYWNKNLNIITFNGGLVSFQPCGKKKFKKNNNSRPGKYFDRRRSPFPSFILPSHITFSLFPWTQIQSMLWHTIFFPKQKNNNCLPCSKMEFLRKGVQNFSDFFLLSGSQRLPLGAGARAPFFGCPTWSAYAISCWAWQQRPKIWV